MHGVVDSVVSHVTITLPILLTEIQTRLAAMEITVDKSCNNNYTAAPGGFKLILTQHHSCFHAVEKKCPDFSSFLAIFHELLKWFAVNFKSVFVLKATHCLYMDSCSFSSDIETLFAHKSKHPIIPYNFHIVDQNHSLAGSSAMFKLNSMLPVGQSYVPSCNNIPLAHFGGL